MPQEPLSSMRLALYPHRCGVRHTEREIEIIIEQCAVTLRIIQTFSGGIVPDAELRDATKGVVLSLNQDWYQIEFERFMCILYNGGHVKLGRNMELVPA